jgi:hydrogenase nickel incorporation protein HypB
MCDTCGCSDGAAVRVTVPHGHEHPHTHTVDVGEAILARNDALAGEIRRELGGRGCTLVNIMGSPGAGKTALLEVTVPELAGRCAVVEGDQETLLDAERIRAAGGRVVQINTGTGCHLDATMLRDGLAELEPAAGAVVFVENVGNLVCPALFDLGEHARVVLASVTEGEDKPVKYPHMFRSADLVLLTKVDLLPYLSFDAGLFAAMVRRVRPDAPVLRVSTVDGTGLDGWYGWLADRQGRSAR